MLVVSVLALVAVAAATCTEPVQLVNSSGNFSAADGLDDALLHAAGDAAFKVVAVVGPQSSGKSTILNSCFGTTFGVMDDANGRGRTTMGVWAQVAPAAPGLLCLDVQGSDSSEAGEEGRTFERKTALLALALADVLMINLWEHDIGRLEASNMALLTNVFEISLELRRSSPDFGHRQKLLFVVRDKTSATPEGALSATLVSQLEEVWQSVRKVSSAGEEGSSGQDRGDGRISDLFEVETAFLPHKVLQPTQWKAAADRLASRADLFGVTDTPFVGVPSDGVCEYARQLWAKILAAAPLHLPSQRALLAEHRCAAIVDRESRRVHNRIRALRKHLRRLADAASSAAEATTPGKAGEDGTRAAISPSMVRTTTFRRRCEAVLSTALTSYDQDAARYCDHAAFEKHRLALSKGQWEGVLPRLDRRTSGFFTWALTCPFALLTQRPWGRDPPCTAAFAPLASQQLRAISSESAKAFVGSLAAAVQGADVAAGEGAHGPLEVLPDVQNGGEAGEVRAAMQLKHRAVTHFDRGASRSAPRQARLGKRHGWAPVQAAEHRRLIERLDVEVCDACAYQPCQQPLPHDVGSPCACVQLDVWRRDRQMAAMHFELGLARAAEAHARSVAAKLASAAVRRRALPAVGLLFVGILLLVR